MKGAGVRNREKDNERKKRRIQWKSENVTNQDNVNINQNYVTFILKAW